jgi:hypothetical protein
MRSETKRPDSSLSRLPRASRLKSRSTARLFAAFVVIAIPAAVACGSEDDTRYGGPLGLSGKKVPPATTATSTANVTALAPCTDAGLSAVEGGSCTVSFQQTIFTKYMSATGTWKCTDSNCHGPSGSAGTSTNAPTIDGTDPLKAYTALAQFTTFPGQNSAPYINACSTDPTASVLDCNLNGACSPKMPQSGAGVSVPGPTAQEIEDVETWLKCGAPYN